MKNAQILHWKYPDAALRCFENELAATQAGESEVIELAGMLVKWPAELSLPNESDLAIWEVEYKDEMALNAKKAEALKAIESKRQDDELTKAMADKNAPQAVKDYAAMKGK